MEVGLRSGVRVRLRRTRCGMAPAAASTWLGLGVRVCCGEHLVRVRVRVGARVRVGVRG